MRIEQIILGLREGDRHSTQTIVPASQGPTIVPLETARVRPDVVAAALRETLASPTRTSATDVLPFLRLTAVAGEVTLSVADDAALELRMLTQTREGGVPLLLEASTRADRSAEDDERMDALLRRIHLACGVDDGDLLMAILSQEQIEKQKTEASPDEIAYVEAHRAAVELAREVHRIDDRMTASVVPDWLWIATTLGGVGVFMTVIALLYPDLRVYVVPAMTLFAVIGFAAYAWRSFRELRVRGALQFERKEVRARREEARARVKHLAAELARRGVDADRSLARSSDLVDARRVPAIMGRAEPCSSSSEGVRDRQVIVFVANAKP